MDSFFFNYLSFQEEDLSFLEEEKKNLEQSILN